MFARKAMLLFEKEDAWNAFDDDRMRRNWFEDHIQHLRREERVCSEMFSSANIFLGKGTRAQGETKCFAQRFVVIDSRDNRNDIVA